MGILEDKKVWSLGRPNKTEEENNNARQPFTRP